MLTIRESFISQSDALSIIKKSNEFFTKATVLGLELDGYRTAESTFLSKTASEVINILKAVAAITNLPVDNQEAPHVVKYTEGGQYKEHYDFFYHGADYYSEQMARGGQRVKTALIYLNDDFEGGETKFFKTDLVVKPETGKLIIWDNTNADGTLNYQSLHAGLPVKSGVKYIFVVWIREKRFL